jgi:hypothetical protein
MTKCFKLFDGRFCDEHRLLLDFIKDTEQVKEYELYKSALVEEEFET